MPAVIVSYLTAVGNTLYFQAYDGTNGYELWKSDGTASGTVMVKEHCPRAVATVFPLTSQPLATPSISQPKMEPTWETNCGRAMELPSGTVMVKDISSGSGSSSPSYLTAVGNTLYFQASDGTNGDELWKSDGTASGTVMVKDIDSGSGTVISATSQPLATPSISEPTTEPTESNCGRAMELPQAR